MKKLLLMFALLLGVVGAKAEDVLGIVPKTVAYGKPAQSIQISMTNASEVSAVQFDLYLPEGMAYSSVSGVAARLIGTRKALVYDIETDDYVVEEVSQDYATVASNKQPDGSVRILLVPAIYDEYDEETGEAASVSSPIKGYSGNIITLTVNTTGLSSDGVYPIVLKDVTLSSSEGTVARYDVVTSYVAVAAKASNVAPALENEDLALEGYVPSFVTAALANAMSTTLDLSAVTGIGGTLTLKDGVELVPPTEEITIPEVTYTRTTGNTYGTICLPYAVEPDATVKYYAVDGLADGKLSLTELAKVEAGTPAIFEKQSGDGVTATATNVTIPVVDSHVAGGDVQLIGTYTRLKVVDKDAYYIKDDKFWSINEYFYINAYRAYLRATSASAKVIGIGEEATAIDALDALTSGEYDGIYAPNGVRTDKLQKGVNLIKTGDKVKKVFVK